MHQSDAAQRSADTAEALPADLDESSAETAAQAVWVQVSDGTLCVYRGLDLELGIDLARRAPSAVVTLHQ